MSKKTNKEKVVAKDITKTIAKATTTNKFEGVRNVNAKGEINFKEGSSAAFCLDLYIKYNKDSKKMVEAVQKAEKAGLIKSTNPAGRVARVIAEINMITKTHEGTHVVGVKA